MFMQGQQIILEEQGLRDGLQTLSVNIPIAKKLEWINQLVDAGLRRLQVTSFVHPKLVPQMADAEELMQAIAKRDDIVYSALVLNTKGVERAVAINAKHLAISLSASDTHSRKNANKTLAAAKTEFAAMVKLALANNMIIRGGIQCAFGCRYEGKIDEALVFDLVQHHLDCGVHELALADSTGMANPMQMKRMMQQVLSISKNVPVALHLHNTENKGYANVCAAIEVGVTQFDTAFGGLGGCPFIKGATGNIATEDTVHMLYQMGYTTNIDMHKVAAVSLDMQNILHAPLPGLMYGLLQQKDIQLT